MPIANRTGLLLVLLLLHVWINAQQRAEVVQVQFADKKTVTTLYDGSYALIIGVSDYKNWRPLPGVKDDIVAVRSALQKHRFTVEVLENPRNQEELYSGIRAFITRYGFTKENRLVIYFAGHGYTGKTTDGRNFGYIVPSEAPLPSADGVGFEKTAMSMGTVEYLAREIRAKHALFIFDSCFSGSLFENRAGEIVVPPFIEEKVDHPVRQFITAGSANQTVPDKSIFREFFVRALNGEAANQDGYILTSELAAFLSKNVANYSHRQQTPQYGVIWDTALDQGDFVFVLPNVIETLQKVRAESDAWEAIKNAETRKAVEAFLEKYPNGQYFSQARRLLEKVWWRKYIPNYQEEAEISLFLEEFRKDKDAAYVDEAKQLLEKLRDAKQNGKAKFGGFEGVLRRVDSGLPVPNAQITIEFKGTGLKATVQSDANGRFQKQDLPPGEYDIWIRGPGYEVVQLTQVCYAYTMNRVQPVPILLKETPPVSVAP